MIERTYDLDLLNEATREYQSGFVGFDAPTWISNPLNLMFVQDGNVGLAQFNYPGVYTPHYFFRCRGKEARDLARAMLMNCFDNYEVQLFRGITPHDNRPAMLMARMIGFESLGSVHAQNGMQEIFMLTKPILLEKVK